MVDKTEPYSMGGWADMPDHVHSLTHQITTRWWVFHGWRGWHARPCTLTHQRSPQDGGYFTRTHGCMHTHTHTQLTTHCTYTMIHPTPPHYTWERACLLCVKDTMLVRIHTSAHARLHRSLSHPPHTQTFRSLPSEMAPSSVPHGDI